MERKEKKPFSTMMGLLRAMTREFGSRKTGATLMRIRSTPLRIYVEEYFDDGKGHSGAFTSDCTDVVPEFFERAQCERFISGKLEPGYVSQWEFVITELGEEMYHQRVQFANKILELFPSGEATRACDLQLALHSYRLDEEAIQDILDWLTSERYLDSHEHVGQTFYLLGLRQKVA